MSVLKTYGVTGLVEWNTVIKAGKATMRVVFSGGALTAYGTTPATFATRNPLVQTIIEHSDYFKEGRITLISQHGESDPKPKPKKAAPAVVEEAGKEPAQGDDAPKGEETAPENADEPNSVEVTCLDDAKEYLRDKFGVRNIRTKADANKAAAENGIVFVGLK